MSSRLIDHRDLVTVLGSRAVKLPFWRRAKARVLAGEGRARICVVGSSTPLGIGAGGGAGYSDGAAAKRFSTRMSERFNALGLRSRSDSIFGTGNLSAQNAGVLDTRLTMPSGWAPFGAAPTVGGPVFQNASNTNALVFAPANEFDRWQLGYTQTTSSPDSIEVLLDGVVVETINTSGSAAFIRKDYTVTKGIHTVGVRKVNANATNAFIHSFECWDNSAPHVSVCSAGWSGSDAASWNNATSVTRPMPVLRTHAFDLTVIMLGINAQGDATLGTLAADVATWSAHMQSIIDYAPKDAGGVKTGDAVLIVPQGTVYDATIQAAFAAETRRLAEVNGCAIFDLYERFESYAAQTTMGYNISSPSHVSAVAHQDIGAALADFLLAA